MERGNLRKKRNLSELEIDTFESEVEVNKVFGSVKTGTKGAQKNAVWRMIPAAVDTMIIFRLSQIFFVLQCKFALTQTCVPDMKPAGRFDCIVRSSPV